MGFIRTQPITEPQIPQAIARDSEVSEAVAAHKAEVAPHSPEYIEFSPAQFNNIDFHTGPIWCDHDSRILAWGGNGSNGQGEMMLQALILHLFADVKIRDGSPVKRLISATGAVDPPLLAANASHTASIALPGSLVGDFCLATAIGTVAASFLVAASINTGGIASVYLRNLTGASFDSPPFTVRVVAVGF